VPKTSPVITFGLFALVAKADSSPAADDMQPFVMLANLRTGNVTTRPYATFEPDYWLLDGNYKFAPTSPALARVGFWSLAMSDSTGAFAIPPVLTINFSQVHSTDGIALRFAQASNDYPADLTVAFYDDTDALIRQDDYAPTASEFGTNEAVEDFKKIIITFRRTNKPYRYLRITGIDYGKLFRFTGDDIRAASVVEEIDPISAELPVSTLDLLLHSDDANFNIVDPSGDFASLRERQPIDAYVTIDGELRYVGQFFLETWQSPSKAESNFAAVDMVGVLDKLPYLGGLWSSPESIADLLDDILTAADIPYELSPELTALEFTGWLPISTRREALQQVCFAAGAYVTTAGSGTIRISPFRLAADLTEFENIITDAERGSGTLDLLPAVTGVEVLAHAYTPLAVTEEIYKETLPAGEHTIKFREPKHTLSITGGTITESGANYAIVDTDGDTVIISGRAYSDATKTFAKRDDDVPAGVRLNVLTINGATLISIDNAQETAERIFDYYQQRYKQTVKLYGLPVEVGESALVDAMLGYKVGGIIERSEINLAGGYVFDSTVIGTVRNDL